MDASETITSFASLYSYLKRNWGKDFKIVFKFKHIKGVLEAIWNKANDVAEVSVVIATENIIATVDFITDSFTSLFEFMKHAELLFSGEVYCTSDLLQRKAKKQYIPQHQ